MIGNERLITFINSLEPDHTEFLERLEQNAREEFVPVIRRETQQLLKLLLAMQRPKRILEVGTAVGFSALFMAEYNPVSCEIVTIENYKKRIPIARANFKEAKREGQITLLEGDAQKILPSLQEPFDFIFMDAAKGQYIHFLPDIRRLLSPTGLLVSDNILQDGELMESKYAVIRRNRTIHNRMRAYLYELTHCEELETTILPIADGVALSAKRSAQTGKEMGDKKE